MIEKLQTLILRNALGTFLINDGETSLEQMHKIILACQKKGQGGKLANYLDKVELAQDYEYMIVDDLLERIEGEVLALNNFLVAADKIRGVKA